MACHDRKNSIYNSPGYIHYITVDNIKNPKPYSRFIGQINEVTIHDKYGNLKSEPKDWIKFGKEWYDKRKL